MAVDPDAHTTASVLPAPSVASSDDPADGHGPDGTGLSVGVDSPAVQIAPVAIISIDGSGLVQSWNHAAEHLFGWCPDDVIGRALPISFLEPRSNPILDVAASGHRAAIHDVACTAAARDGSPVHLRLSATFVPPTAADAGGVVAIATDVSSDHRRAQALDAANHRWRHLLMNISDTITILDRLGRVKETTGQLIDILGYPSDRWEGSNGFDFIHADERARAAELWNALMDSPGLELTAVLRTRHADGHHELVEYTAVNLFDDPIIAGMVMTTRNVTRSKRAEDLLADQAKVLELIARDAPLDETLTSVSDLVERHGEGGSAVLLVDRGTSTLRIASSGSVPPDRLQRWSTLPPPMDAPTFGLPDLATLDDRDHPAASWASTLGPIDGYSLAIRANDSSSILGVLATHYHETRRPTGHELEVATVAGNLAAIAIERAEWHRALTHQARHHAVTELPNRTSIREHLDAAIALRDGTPNTIAVMFIDLDHFKVVNDTLGHAAGDLLLARFARRLQNLVRPGDFVGHFGADTFTVILEVADDHEAIRFIAHRLDLALGEPFALDENEVHVAVSIGVAMYGDGDGIQETSDDLIQHADAALFRAKDLGGGRMEIFDHAMRRLAGERLRIDRDLRGAIERQEFEVHYQPEIDLADGAIIGVEALLRWNHPSLGLLLPEDFLGVAEDTGVIVSIGIWVLEQALGWTRAWTDRRPDLPLSLSVNLSTRQLASPGLAPHIASLLDEFGVPPSRLTIELDEGIMIDDREAALEVLNQIREIGVRIAIDDFGTGFSSLSYLHRFPVDIVKIDPSFASSLEADGGGSPVATAIIQMAHALGIVASAEGVEFAEQLDGLRSLGCDRAQGFLFSGALPGDEVSELIQRSDRAW